MSKNILIISSTSGNNYSLANSLKEKLDQLGNDSSILNLEDYDLPLFKPNVSAPEHVIASLTQKFSSADGYIFCSPEYNGGITPILTNAITWISTTSNSWRDAFNNKSCLIATFSGGPGTRFLASFRSQCEYIGLVVMPRTISVTSYNSPKDDSIIKSLKQLLNHI